jgi:hypothetical protein
LFKVVIDIAGFVRAFFYFWVFGLISVLLDLDHIIQVYQNGLELNLENLAFHGGRTLHIPILIFAGCICLITTALLLRFWNLKHDEHLNMSTSKKPESTGLNLDPTRTEIMINIASSTSILPKISAKKPITFIVECPNCFEFMGVIPTNGKTEFPCPFCGIEGYIESL